MKKVMLAISFIMLLFSIFVFIKCFNEDGKEKIKEDLLVKYHITNISVGNYSIDIVKQKASLSVKDGLIKYYDIYLDKLGEYLDIISKVNNDIDIMNCLDGYTLPYIGVKYDNGNTYKIVVWCDRNVKIINDYSYDDIVEKFNEIIDNSSERLEIVGTKNELINKYGIAGIRLETSRFFGFGYYDKNDTTIIVGEKKAYRKDNIAEDYKINEEKLSDFLNIIKNVNESNKIVSYAFEGTYFVITYTDGHQIEIIDNKNDEKLIDNYTFDDLNSMFIDIFNN